MIKFSVNQFPCTDYFYKIKPDFHVLMDPAYRVDSGLVYMETMNNLNKVDWPLTVIMPMYFGQKNFVTDTVVNDMVKFKFFNTEHNNITEFSNNILYKWASNELCPRVQNVIIGVIYFAINIGIKNIFLSGVEFDLFKTYIVDENNMLYRNKNCHFYDEANKTELIAIPMNMKESLQRFIYALNSFEMLKEYAKYAGCNIYNLTLNSYIDVYKKVKW